MGRIVDLLGEVAAAAEEGPEGLVLSAEEWDRLRADWTDEDIEDALSLVHDSLLQSELVEASDSLSARMLEVLGDFGDAASFSRAQAIPLLRGQHEALRALVRRSSDLTQQVNDTAHQATPGGYARTHPPARFALAVIGVLASPRPSLTTSAGMNPASVTEESYAAENAFG